MKPTQQQIAAARIVLRASTCFGDDICRSTPCACAYAVVSVVTNYVAAERARCAKIAENFPAPNHTSGDTRFEIAAAIRAEPNVSDAFGGPFPEE